MTRLGFLRRDMQHPIAEALLIPKEEPIEDQETFASGAFIVSLSSDLPCTEDFPDEGIDLETSFDARHGFPL